MHRVDPFDDGAPRVSGPCRFGVYCCLFVVVFFPFCCMFGRSLLRRRKRGAVMKKLMMVLVAGLMPGVCENAHAG